jgi:hypothetical protein
MVLMVSHLSGSSGATPDPLRCSCVLGHRHLDPNVVTVAVIIASTLIAAICVPVAFSLPRCPLVAFILAPVRPIASEWDTTIWLCILPGVSGCVFFKHPINDVMPWWNVAAVIRRLKPKTPLTPRKNVSNYSGIFNSLTTIDAHERQLFNELHWWLVTSLIFVRC